MSGKQKKPKSKEVIENHAKRLDTVKETAQKTGASGKGKVDEVFDTVAKGLVSENARRIWRKSS